MSRKSIFQVYSVVLVIAIVCLDLTSSVQIVKAQVGNPTWSPPELIFAGETGDYINELSLLRDQSDRIYLWWPVIKIETPVNDALELTGTSSMFHTEWIDSAWQRPIDVLVPPDASRLASAVIDDQGMIHVFSATDCLSYVVADHNQSMSAQGWSQRRCLDDSGQANPTVARSPDGTIYVVYSGQDTQALRLITSTDDGIQWTPPSIVEESIEGFVSDPALAVDSKGRLHLVWAVHAFPSAYPPLGVFYSRSDDGGETWTNPTQLGQEQEGQPAIAVYEDDVHVLWNGDASKRGRYYRFSSNAGETWGPVETLSPSSSEGGEGGLQRPPAIIVDNVGNVHALLHEQETLYYISKTRPGWQDKELLYPPDTLKSDEIYAVRLAITGGSQLHALYSLRSYTRDPNEDERAKTFRIFHQTRRINAKPAEPVPWPTPTPVALITPTARLDIPVAETPKPTTFPDLGTGNRNFQSNPTMPVFVGSIGGLAVLGWIIIFTVLKKKK